MLLQSKTAVIFGAGGSLGRAIAQAFAKEGAMVFVSGQHLDPVQQLANEIVFDGGRAEAFEVDALNKTAVDDHISDIISKAGKIDISMCLIRTEDLQGIPLVDLSVEDFTRPIKRIMESQFITGTAAGRAMMKQGSGVILSLTATPGGIGYPNVGGFGPGCHVMENISLGLATELGPYGIRVVNIRSGGSPDSQIFKDAIEFGGDKVKDFIKKMVDDTMLKRMPLMKDIANTAVFLASDMAAGITGVTVDVTCGTTSALNYIAPPIAFVER